MTRYIKYLILGFFSFFSIGIIGVSIEDLVHNYPLKVALTELHHYITPLFLGLMGLIVANFIWRKRTKQLKANKALIESEERFKRLSELTFEGIFIHENGKIKEVNKAFENIFKYNQNEVKNLNAVELFVNENNKNIVQKYLNWDYAPPYEVEAIDKNKCIIPVELESKNITYNKHTVSVTAVRNIQKRKKAQDELKKFYTIVEQSANNIIITDLTGSIIYVNTAFYNTTGYTRSEVINKNPSILKSGKQNTEFYESLWQTIKSGKVWSGEFCNKKKNGELYWEFATITPVFDSKNKLQNYIAIKENITEKKHAEKKILETIIETEEKERKRFAEDLHDELGPFLSGINLYINELSYEDVDFEKRKSIIDYLKYFVNEAVDKTRSISHKLMPNTLYDYGLRIALESFCNKITNSGVLSINLNINANVQLNRIHEVVIYRIAIELINNTIKHAQAKNINISISKTDSNILFNFSDNGKGFDLNSELKSKKGLGIQNILNRLETLKGIYSFEKLNPNGIKFNFIFPLV